MALKLSTRDNNGVTIIDLSGRIVFGDESAMLRDKVKSLIPTNSRIILNLAQISYIDSGGLGKEVHLLNLLCAEGVRSVPLGQVERLRFLNAALDAEFRGALRVLAAAHDSQKKSVRTESVGSQLKCRGTGLRVSGSISLSLSRSGRPPWP